MVTKRTRFLKGTFTGIHPLPAVNFSLYGFLPVPWTMCIWCSCRQPKQSQLCVLLHTQHCKAEHQHHTKMLEEQFCGCTLITSESAGLCPNLCKSKISNVVKKYFTILGS